jgi:PAS domain S-box-containing protein
MADSAIVGVPVEKRSVWAAVSNLFLRGYLRIGRRLAICFVAIVLSMLLSDLVAFWQFTRIAASERHLSDADQISLAVIRVHLDVDTFRDRLATLVNTHDTRQFETEAASVRQKFLEHVTHAQQLLKAVPGIGQDAGILSALSTLHITMQSQVDAVVELAHSDDWEAVRLRLADQIVALIRLSSSLVSRVDQELSQERAQAIENSRRAGRQLFLILPTTAVLTLLMAIALGWYATRSITGPLSALEAAARALARGEFEHEVAAPGRDELATVGKAFNYACRRLRELYDELRESEEQWRAAFVNNPTMYFMVDSASTILSVNAFGAEQLGYNEAELIGRPLLNFFYEGDREAVKKRADACFEQLGRRTRWEARTIRKDGTMLWIRETANAVILKKRPVLLIVCEDITERKWAEEERERLRKIEADLAHVDRVTTMGEMAASLAHELKQPIAAAATNASTCLRWLKRDRPDIDEACATAARIISDVNRANDIIIRVRSLYKKSAPERELVDVSTSSPKLSRCCAAKPRDTVFRSGTISPQRSPKWSQIASKCNKF